MDTTIRDERSLRTTSNCCISWSAVAAGALVAFSLSVLLNLLNAGLGLVSFPEAFRALAGVTIGGYIWLILCGIIAMFIAGWVAGKIVQNFAGTCYGILHGFLAWSLALLLLVLVASHFASSAAAAAGASAADSRADTSRILDTTSDTDKARAEQAADVAGTATLGIFFIFLLGAAAACLGGYVGAKNGKSHTHTPHTQTPSTRY